MEASGLSHAPSGVSPWAAPWFDLVRPELEVLGEHALAGRFHACREALDALARARGLHNIDGLPLRFVDAARVSTPAYEAHIRATGEVPTRCTAEGGWHDFFNALVWLACPRSKARLNALQAEVLSREGVNAVRGGVRDAATVFDENAALFVSRDEGLCEALQGFRWPELFVHGRARFLGGVRVLVFGHALLDKLRHPYKAVCAHAWRLSPDEAADRWPPDAGRAPWRDTLDERLAQSLARASLQSAAFHPLPVLGIPGWWPANEDAAFYDDPAVFRPGRRRRAA